MKHKVIIILFIFIIIIGVGLGIYYWKKIKEKNEIIEPQTGLKYGEIESYDKEMYRISLDETGYRYYTKEELIELIKQFDERNKTIDKEYFYIVNFQYEGIEYPAFKDKSHKKIDLEKTEERFHQLTQRLEDNCTYRLEIDCTNEKWILINLFHIIKEEKPIETEEEEDFISPNRIYSNFLWME